MTVAGWPSEKMYLPTLVMQRFIVDQLYKSKYSIFQHSRCLSLLFIFLLKITVIRSTVGILRCVVLFGKTKRR